ncbi:MAG: hypothetical protein ACRDFB_10775 [Rhabdochlamydiaceae bacterium]
MHFGKKKRNSLKISYGNEENEPKTEVITFIPILSPIGNAKVVFERSFSKEPYRFLVLLTVVREWGGFGESF